MRKEYLKRIISVCLVLILVLGICSPVEVKAAKVGDVKYTYQTYTLKEITALTKKFKQVKNEAKSMMTIPKIISDIIETAVPGGGAAISLYENMTDIALCDLAAEYKFYNNIKKTMKNKGYKKVKIRYTSKYSVYKFYGDRYYTWKITGKAANKYYK